MLCLLTPVSEAGHVPCITQAKRDVDVRCRLQGVRVSAGVQAVASRPPVVLLEASLGTVWADGEAREASVWNVNRALPQPSVAESPALPEGERNGAALPEWTNGRARPWSADENSNKATLQPVDALG